MYSICNIYNCHMGTTDRCSLSSIHLTVVNLTTVTYKQLTEVVSVLSVSSPYLLVKVVASTTMSCKITSKKCETTAVVKFATESCKFQNFQLLSIQMLAAKWNDRQIKQKILSFTLFFLPISSSQNNFPLPRNVWKHIAHLSSWTGHLLHSISAPSPLRHHLSHVYLVRKY